MPVFYPTAKAQNSFARLPSKEKSTSMIRTVEAVIDEHSVVLVTIGEEEPNSHEISLLSETALTEDWNRPEEEAAWSHLQPVLPSVWA